MEALILFCFAWLAMALYEFAYWSVVGLTRWAPAIAIGVVAVWIMHSSGAAELHSLATGIVASLVVRQVGRMRY